MQSLNNTLLINGVSRVEYLASIGLPVDFIRYRNPHFLVSSKGGVKAVQDIEWSKNYRIILPWSRMYPECIRAKGSFDIQILYPDTYPYIKDYLQDYADIHDLPVELKLKSVLHIRDNKVEWITADEQEHPEIISDALLYKLEHAVLYEHYSTPYLLYPEAYTYSTCAAYIFNRQPVSKLSNPVVVMRGSPPFEPMERTYPAVLTPDDPYFYQLLGYMHNLFPSDSPSIKEVELDEYLQGNNSLTMYVNNAPVPYVGTYSGAMGYARRHKRDTGRGCKFRGDYPYIYIVCYGKALKKTADEYRWRIVNGPIPEKEAVYVLVDFPRHRLIIEPTTGMSTGWKNELPTHRYGVSELIYPLKDPRFKYMHLLYAGGKYWRHGKASDTPWTETEELCAFNLKKDPAPAYQPYDVFLFRKNPKYIRDNMIGYTYYSNGMDRPERVRVYPKAKTIIAVSNSNPLPLTTTEEAVLGEEKMQELYNEHLSLMEQLIATHLIKEKGDTILQELIPSIDKYVKENYGLVTRSVSTKIVDTGVTLNEVTHEMFQPVLTYVLNDIPVMLVGPAGSGKSYIAEQVAKATNKAFYFTNAVTNIAQIFGFKDASGEYHPSSFYEAFKNGGVFMLDEMDASIPEVLTTLNAAIGNGYHTFPCGFVKRHPDFRLIAACNTFGLGADYKYIGRNQLDAASLNRFVPVYINYDTHIDNELAEGDEELVFFITKYREVLDKNKINAVCSYRDIKTLHKMEKALPDQLKMLMQQIIIRNIPVDLLQTMKKDMSGYDTNRFFKIFGELIA